MGGASKIAWRTLGDTCHLQAGKTISAQLISDTQTAENSVPCYGANGLREYASIFKVGEINPTESGTKMTKLDELIAELYPDGVKYKELGTLGKFYGGLTGKKKDDFKDGNAKFITYKNVYSNPALDVLTDDKVKIIPGESQRTLLYGDIIFTGSSETPDECGMSSVVTVHTDEPMYLNSFCFFFRFNDSSIMLPDFAKHLFRSDSLRYQIGKTASGVTRYNVSKKLMGEIRIPVPPLSVQREIVRILDNFAELTADLNIGLPAEIEARQKQYEYYRDKLLSFKELKP